MSEWWNQLRWSAKAQGWYAKTDDLLLFVPESVYQRHLKIYFQNVGLEPKTDTERIQLSEEERKRLYEAEGTFLANVEYWRDVHETGVEMYPRNSTEVSHHKPSLQHPLPASVLAEQPRQQEIARLLEYVKAGELTLREAANIVDGLQLL